jgi:hypothetical protein
MSVNGTDPVFFYGVTVSPGRIAFVLGEPVFRIPLVITFHQAIPRDLGHNRGGGNRNAAGIPFDDSDLGQRQGGTMVSVDQQKISLGLKMPNGHSHRQQCGLKDVDAVDNLRIDNTDTDGQGITANALIRCQASPGGQLFGIPDTVYRSRIGPNDRRRDHGAGQGTSPDFIDTGHPAIPPGAGVIFETL